MLWTFKFLVEDKNVLKVLWLLQGYARDMETPRPVVNAKTVGDKTRARHPDIMAALTSECRKHATVTTNDMTEFLTDLGYAPGSISKYIRLLKDVGVLAEHQSADGTYKVIKPKAKAQPKVKAKRKAKKRKTTRAHKANGNGVSPTA